MTINLRPEHEKVIAEAIQSGACQNPDTEVAEKIERAFGQFDRGEFLSSEESRADMEKRKTAWLNDRKR